MNTSIGLFLGTLMQSRNQAHIYHLQTSSYAAHKALETYYEDIVGLIDIIAEEYQGIYGVIRGYQMQNTIKEDDKVISYFTNLAEFVEKHKSMLPDDPGIQNNIDTILTLVNTTCYKLKFLQ